MKIATSPTREQYPLSPKKIIKKTINNTGGFVGIGVLALLAAIASSFIADLNAARAVIWIAFFILLVLIVASVLLNYFYQRWYFATYFYDLTDDHIVIRKGPITPNEITIPYERVQDVYVDQDILDRLFGLYDVHLSSATVSSGMSAHIDGLEKTAADGMRDVLLKKVNERMHHGQAQKAGASPEQR